MSKCVVTQLTYLRTYMQKLWKQWDYEKSELFFIALKRKTSINNKKSLQCLLFFLVQSSFLNAVKEANSLLQPINKPTLPNSFT